jgi:hypothetical protein
VKLAFLLRGERLHVEVVLSHRNLRTLLAKAADEDSRRTIIRDVADGVSLIVRAEDDNDHYRDRAPGQMAPWTEAQLLLFPDRRESEG